MRLIDLLKKSSVNQPDAAVWRYEGGELSYADFFRIVTNLAEKLRSAGCGAGVKAAIVLNNSIEYLAAFFAISAAEAVICPLSANMTGYELEQFLSKAGVSVVITHHRNLERLAETMQNGHKTTIICIEYRQGEGLQFETRRLEKCVPDSGCGDIALMAPTSGTSGIFKIVMLTDFNLITNMAVYRTLMGFSGRNNVYCTLPMHHIYCICAQILTHISLADTFIINRGPFLVTEFIEAVKKYRITISAFVPYMAMLLAEYPYDTNIESLQIITLSGAKTPELTLAALERRFGTVHFVSTYGMTEAGSRVSIAAPLNRKYPAGSVGRPMPGVLVKIVDSGGREMPEGGVGRVMVKSSGVMAGYYKQSQLTEQTLAMGWLNTGDLGRFDGEGNLFLVGREKDIIISGGQNIYPDEIEQCLMEHPSIKQAVVVAKTDKLLQEVPCAFVVRRNASEAVKPAEIIRFCRTRLSNYKLPSSILFLDSMPMLSSSKVNREALRKMAESGG